jgi:hypothetical protein
LGSDRLSLTQVQVLIHAEIVAHRGLEHRGGMLGRRCTGPVPYRQW